MRTVSPERSEHVIEEETSRLRNLEKELQLRHYIALHGNNFIKLLAELGKLSSGEIATILESASDKEDFLSKLNQKVSSIFAHQIEDMLRAYKDAQDEVNEMRTVLGREPFKFEETQKQNDIPRPFDSYDPILTRDGPRSDGGTTSDAVEE